MAIERANETVCVRGRNALDLARDGKERQMKSHTLATLAGVLAAMLLGIGVVAQGTMTVEVGDIRAPHGEDVEIPIDVKGASGVGAMHIELTYDTAVLSPIREVQAGDLAGGGLVVGNTSTPGRVTISIAHANGFSGDGVVAKVVARVAGQDGASTPLSLQNVTANHFQTKAAIAATVSNGTFTEGGAGSKLAIWGLFGLLAVVIAGAAAYAFTRRTTRRPAAVRASAAAAQAPAAAAAMGLMVARGSASPSFVPLSRPVTTIGRSSSNQVILEDEMASREHARVVSSGGVHTLYDLGSANGTSVNGQQVTQRVLQVGDQITMGSTTLVVRQS